MKLSKKINYYSKKNRIQRKLEAKSNAKLRSLIEDLGLEDRSKIGTTKEAMVNFIITKTDLNILSRTLFPNFWHRNIQAIGIICTVLGMIVSITTYKLSATKVNPPDSELMTIPSFDANDSTRFKIAFLPLKPDVNCVELDADYKGALLERFKLIQENDSLPIGLLSLPSDIFPCPLTNKEAYEIGDSVNADLVIWGNYIEGETGLEKIRLRYTLISDSTIDSGKNNGDSQNQEIDSLSQLTNGYLQEDIDYVFNWVLGFMEFEKGHYNNAAKHFSLINNEYPNYKDLGTYLRILYVYNEIGEYEKAIEYGKKAIKEFELKANTKPIELSTIYDYTGLSYWRLSDYDRALDYLNMALDIRSEYLGEKHPLIAQSYEHFALVYYKMNLLTEALTIQLKGISILEQLENPSYLITVPSYSNLGLFYKDLGRYNEALAAHKRTLKILRKKLDPNHASIATACNNIALDYKALGKLKEAVKYNRLAIELREEVLPVGHVDFAQSYNNLGNVLTELGDFEKSLNYLNQALVIAQRDSNSNLYLMSYIFNNLSKVYSRMGEYDLALDFQLKCIEIREEKSGCDNLQIAGNYKSLGAIYLKMNLKYEALEYADRARLIYKNHSAALIPKLAKNFIDLSELYAALGMGEVVLELHEKAMLISEKFYFSSMPIKVKT